MSKLESKVTERRHHTRWAKIDLEYLMRDLAWNERTDPAKKNVILKVAFRYDVTSRMWWTMEWTNQKGERKAVGAQTLDILLWRVAHIELEAHNK